MKLFRNDAEAVFVSRPNRFVIIAEKDGEQIRCHCPNPGRMTECLLPGAPLILEKRAEGTNLKTEWTAAAVRYKGRIVPLFASRANRAAEELILPEIIKDLREIRGEYRAGASRFDFFCRDGKGRNHLVEVKACSLVEKSVAMFPDAPSERALKHLEELAILSKEGYICHVLFVILYGKPEVFIPNLHTDPLFARAVFEYRDTVYYHAALIKCNAGGDVRLLSPAIPVDLSHSELAVNNRGSYFIILRLNKFRTITVGALGELFFRKGYYIYCGSAQKNLSRRTTRHSIKTGKKQHWHIDYLTPYASSIEAYPVASYRNLECAMARSLAKIGGRGIPRFGSSDCKCKSHLFYFREAPLLNPGFIQALFYFRHRAFSKKDEKPTPPEIPSPQ